MHRHRNVRLSPCLRARWSRCRQKAAMKLNKSSPPKHSFIGFLRYRREQAARVRIGIDGAIEHSRWSKGERLDVRLIMRVDIWGRVACVRVSVNDRCGSSYRSQHMRAAHNQFLCVPPGSDCSSSAMPEAPGPKWRCGSETPQDRLWHRHPAWGTGRRDRGCVSQRASDRDGSARPDLDQFF